MKRLIAIILASLMVLLATSTAASEEPSSCTFSGTAKLDDAEVADGTLITAVIAGDEYHTHTSTGYGYSTYHLTISTGGGKNYSDGTKVTFKVNGHPTGQNAIFKAGANVRLDLTASTAPAASSLPIVAIVSALVLALLAAGIAYYLLIHRRGLKIADWLRGRGAIPSGQAIPWAMEGQGQPRPKYIWDNAKLAWVENTKLAQSKPRIVQRAKGGVKADVPVFVGTGTPQQLGQDTSIAVDGERQIDIERQTARTKRKVATDDPEMLVLYKGDVRLLVETSLTRGPLPTFTRHLRQLGHTHQISIGKIEAVSKQSARFELLLQRPVPLLKILKALPEVDTVSAVFRGNRDSHPTAQTAASINTRTILVKLGDPNRYAVRNSKSTLNTRTIEVQLK